MCFCFSVYLEMSLNGHARLSQIHTISRSHGRKTKTKKLNALCVQGASAYSNPDDWSSLTAKTTCPQSKLNFFIFYRDLKKIREYRIREEARKQGNTANRGESTTHRFGRDEHLHHEALHALAGKRRKRCAPPFGGDCAHQLLPRPRKGRNLSTTIFAAKSSRTLKRSAQTPPQHRKRTEERVSNQTQC